jgi:hypothetical protein
VSISAGAETVYMTHADALTIAKGIRAAALSCKREAFSASPPLTVSKPARSHGEPRKGE